MDRTHFRSHFEFGGKTYAYYDLKKVQAAGMADIQKLPYSIRVLLENIVRNFDGKVVTEGDVKEVGGWKKSYDAPFEIAHHPARVVMQDFTGVPGVVDLAAMRDALAEKGKKASLINPVVPVDLIIDHSVQVDYYGTPDCLDKNVAKEYERNSERYSLLKWAQASFDNMRIVPPRSGICHQVNLEYLGQIVLKGEVNGEETAFCDTLVGTDSHTTMINAIGVMGWGVGGIEAEAVMLGQPYYMPIPEVIGLRLTGEIAEGITGTDVVLTITELLRRHKVVEKFVEVYGPGLKALSLPDRATISNMSPEYGSTMGFFPVDDETIRYMRETNRAEQSQFVENYTKMNMLFYDYNNEPEYTKVVELDLSTVKPCVAGPKKPQQHIPLEKLPAVAGEETPEKKSVEIELEGKKIKLSENDVVVAAITSCTNTSNPFVMIGAGMVAKKAVEKGLKVKPYVKTSLAPGSKVVTDYLEASGVDKYLNQLGFNLAAYGCTTCIGNSGPLKAPINDAVKDNKMSVAAVLSGNRNFEARIHPLIRQNYLASPMLVVVYALAGTVDIDLHLDPVGTDKNGKPVYMRDLWPSNDEVWALVKRYVTTDQYEKRYSEILEGDENWKTLPIVKSDIYEWIPDSTYIRRPPFFEDFSLELTPAQDIIGAKPLAMLGDTVTTDHISPAGAIPAEYPAGQYLEANGVKPVDFNSYGSRRGNHEVMMRGTFGNVRIKNKLADPKEGGFTKHMPDGKDSYIYDAAMKYIKEGTPTVVFGGKEYGTGSSRDWAAKGTLLLGVKAVIAESFERIHRSNLAGMGILPLQFTGGNSWAGLGLDGTETFDIKGIAEVSPRCSLKVTAVKPDGSQTEFVVLCRLDTEVEIEYFKHGGILAYVLRGMAK
ncbi:aconitate hydratase 1 [Denitrovibrio acetiphilus DSM 12809]|uniref:Aconitate hydratase n=1 Tax=Denitrovibrio acetiphilus (strain DSM 12809 / NBRC 114555 / N2460) TaxID=522772 RepID=D4H1N1_DENA2|nr:aconitate hydratase AcnA [Denitrovibrio acetiphilus]ADD68791.1 aconitate hydratase 1 [Denitrovibrio acetiphilus DSM 12809]